MKALIMGTIALLLAPIMAGVIATSKVEPAKAATTDNLGNLITLNGLFTGFNAQQLAGLIAIDNATGGGFGGTTGTSNLSDLIVLNGLFGTHGWGWGWNNTAGLAGLIAIDNLTGGGRI
jgi:hypothetical protein